MSPSPDALEASLSAARSAKTAAIASIVAAAIALAGTVIGGIFTVYSADRAAQKAADSATKTIETQLAGETSKSRAEFLRSQRQELDPKVMEAERVLAEAEVNAYSNTRNYVYGHDPRPHLKQLQADHKRWLNYRASIQVLGSDDTAGIVGAFLKQAEHHSNFFARTQRANDVGDCLHNPSSQKDTTLWKGNEKSTRRYCKQIRTIRMSKVYKRTITLHNDRKAFIAAAQRDMRQ